MNKRTERLKRLWLGAALRGVRRKRAYHRLALAYLVRDPWNLAAEFERFRRVNLIFDRAFGRVNTILEIGCGEGLQSKHLARLCDDLTGVDVVPRATRRAQLEVPTARFITGDVFDSDWSGKLPFFDAVVAFEVLYYLKDINLALRNMTRLGRVCMISCYEEAMFELEPALAEIQNVTRERITVGDMHWIVAWWTNQR